MIHIRERTVRRTFSPETLRLLWIVADLYTERNRAMILLMQAFKRRCSNVRERNEVRSAFCTGQFSAYKRRGVERRKLPIAVLQCALGDGLQYRRKGNGVSNSTESPGVWTASVVLFQPRVSARQVTARPA